MAEQTRREFLRSTGAAMATVTMLDGRALLAVAVWPAAGVAAVLGAGAAADGLRGDAEAGGGAGVQGGGGGGIL